MTIATVTQQFLDQFENYSGAVSCACFTDAEGNRHEIRRAIRSLHTIGEFVKYNSFSNQCRYEPNAFGLISGYRWSVYKADGQLDTYWVIAGAHMAGECYAISEGYESLIKEMIKIAPLANWQWFRGGGEY